MIQRIQSLYMLVTSALMVLMLTMPLGRFLGGDEEFVFEAFGIGKAGAEGEPYLVSTVYMGILMIMAAALPFVNIFLYKWRLLQLRLCFVEIVFLIGVQIYVVMYLVRANTILSEADSHSMAYSVVDVLPVVGVILMWLAARAIFKDEKLIRSLNRIR